jgi:hypothetical protein
MRSSTKWIDYRNPDLKTGVVDSYRKLTRAWIPLYQKLVRAPSSSDGDDFLDLFRKHLPRDEYASVMDPELSGSNQFYASLKLGAAWYGAIMVKRMLDKSRKLDAKIGQDTIAKIYGEQKTDRPDEPRATR